jgi:hypothetical protein
VIQLFTQASFGSNQVSNANPQIPVDKTSSPTREFLSEKLLCFSQLLENYTIHVTTVLLNEADNTVMATVHERVSTDVERQMFRSETLRYVPKLSTDHPVYIQVAYSLPDRAILIQRSFSFEEGEVVQQQPWIRLFDKDVDFDFRGDTPFFGPIVPGVQSLADLATFLDFSLLATHPEGDVTDQKAMPPNSGEEISQPESVIDIPTIGRIVGRGKVGKFGHFEMELDPQINYLPVRYRRTLVQGDQITSYRQLGIDDNGGTDNPILHIWEQCKRPPEPL